MTKKDLSSRHFQRKISEFCELRIAPIASKRVLENVRPYLLSLIIYRKSPPFLNGHIDWTTIGQSCGIEAELTAELKKQLRPSLDAIIRWLGAAPASEERRPPKPTAHQVKKASAGKATCPPSTKKTQRAATDGRFTRSGSTPRGPAPKPISPFPEKLFQATEDPANFQDALAYHMRRLGDTYWQLYRAVVHLNETFDNKTFYPGSRASAYPDLSRVSISSAASSGAIDFQRDISKRNCHIRHVRCMVMISVISARLSGAGFRCILRMTSAVCPLPSVKRFLIGCAV